MKIEIQQTAYMFLCIAWSHMLGQQRWDLATRVGFGGMTLDAEMRNSQTDPIEGRVGLDHQTDSVRPPEA